MLWPSIGRATIHASVVGSGRRLISLVDSDAVAPRPPSTEVRSSGLWIDIGIQTPFEHVTVDLEAFAVELDSADDVFAGAFGVRTPLGCELAWETAGPVVAGPIETAYEVPCTVHGRLLIGDAVVEIDGWGWRSHRWGPPTAGEADACRRGRRSNGEWFVERARGRFDRPFDVDAQRAPVPDPASGDRLQQDLGYNPAGDLAWSRYVGPTDHSHQTSTHEDGAPA